MSWFALLEPMGFLDRFSSNKNTPNNPSPSPASSPGAEPASPSPATTSGGVKDTLMHARERLEAKDLDAALAIYEELLVTSGDRPDILVTLSGDLGSCGYVEQIIELVAPRYDAERHGPATGINLLQAYLATRNTTAAQHLLDILFGLKKPELEERLYGFSNALAELIEAERSQVALPPSALSGEPAGAAPAPKTIHLVSISRPIWAYGLDSVPNLLPAKEGKLRRVAFAQLALPDVPDFHERMTRPEDELGRLCRGIPLWFSETLYFSQQYSPIAAVAVSGQEHYGLFGSEWTTQNIRQLVDTSNGGFDYVFTGALRHAGGDYELTLRLWEIKKYRERKTFTVRWSPATANTVLKQLHEQFRTFMEFTAYPEGTGLSYPTPPNPFAWCDTLGASLTYFLVEKSVLPKEQLATPVETLARVAARAGTCEASSLAWLALRHRVAGLQITEGVPAEAPLTDTPLVAEARRIVGL